MLRRASEPPAATINAPTPIHRLNRSRVRQNEYAAIPMSATAPGIVNRYENARTLGSVSGVPATGIGEASAAVFTAAPATAIANPMKTTTGYRGKPNPARRGRRDNQPLPGHAACDPAIGEETLYIGKH